MFVLATSNLLLQPPVLQTLLQVQHMPGAQYAANDVVLITLLEP